MDETDCSAAGRVDGWRYRVTFPFEQDTAAAVFRRGDVVWMIFDTPVPIEAPRNRDMLKSIASSFEVVPAGNTKVVRMDLVAERLATLGSEGVRGCFRSVTYCSIPPSPSPSDASATSTA